MYTVYFTLQWLVLVNLDMPLFHLAQNGLYKFYQCIVVPVHITFPLWTTFMFVVQLSSQNLLLNDLSPDFIYLFVIIILFPFWWKNNIFFLKMCLYRFLYYFFFGGVGGGVLSWEPLLCQPLFCYFFCVCISCLVFVFNYLLLRHTRDDKYCVCSYPSVVLVHVEMHKLWLLKAFFTAPSIPN